MKHQLSVSYPDEMWLGRNTSLSESFCGKEEQAVYMFHI